MKNECFTQEFSKYLFNRNNLLFRPSFIALWEIDKTIPKNYCQHDRCLHESRQNFSVVVHLHLVRTFKRQVILKLLKTATVFDSTKNFNYIQIDT